MFKNNENCSTKTEQDTVEHVNHGTKLKPFGSFSTSAKPISTDDNGSDNSENFRVRENFRGGKDNVSRKSELQHGNRSNKR